MKKLLLILCIALFSCSEEDKPCSDNIADINLTYTGILENDNLTQEQRTEINASWDKALESPCNWNQ